LRRLVTGRGGSIGLDATPVQLAAGPEGAGCDSFEIMLNKLNTTRGACGGT
jgi:hypothetical protein